MQLIEAIILGIVQGLTEFLPISSSAHLILFPWFFGWSGTLVDSHTFDVALHAGTAVAVLAYFRQDWLRLTGAFFVSLKERNQADPDQRMVWYIILGCVPAGLVGVSFEHFIEENFRNPLLIAITLAVFGGLMIYAEKKGKQAVNLDRMTLGNALAIGVSQAVALIPGVSRSGITITAGLLLGLDRSSAARFSFLLSTPVIVGAAVLKLRHLFHDDIPQNEWVPILVGTVVSAAVGYLCIKYLLRYLASHTLNLFAWYRIALTVVVLGVFMVRL
ncbi:MAG: undecaprenyl-diphosphatase UppP [Nitrospirota bacterium]|nr:undecaprenyl-diphosphatase UppP [Nitrospirota bacterium]